MLVRRHVSRKENDVIPRGLRTILPFFFFLLSLDSFVPFRFVPFRFVRFVRNGEVDGAKEREQTDGTSSSALGGCQGGC